MDSELGYTISACEAGHNALNLSQYNSFGAF